MSDRPRLKPRTTVLEPEAEPQETQKEAPTQRPEASKACGASLNGQACRLAPKHAGKHLTGEGLTWW